MPTLANLLAKRKELDLEIEKATRSQQVEEPTNFTKLMLAHPEITDEWKSLITSVRTQVADAVEFGVNEEDDHVESYELAMKAVYGPSMFNWFNKIS